MITPQLLLDIDSRLRQLLDCTNSYFGGLGLLLMGDVHQLPAVGGSLCAAACDDSSAGGALFRQFQLTFFKQQMRAQGDDDHIKAVEALSDMSVLHPVTEGFLRSLPVLKREDIASDTTWIEAPIGVTNNDERDIINTVQVVRYARSHGKPVIRFRLPLTGAAQRIMEQHAGLIDSCYDRFESKLHGFFAEGAPATLTENLAPSKGLANGTPVRMHALTLSSESDWDRIRNATPGQVITLSEPPLAVHVRIDRRHGPVTNAGESSQFNPEESIIPGAPVIPLVKRANRKLFVRLKNAEIKYESFAYDLAFAVTYYKLQGSTLPKVILDLNDHPSKQVDMASLYVGLSRVRSAGDIRVLPWRSLGETFAHLTSLTHNPAVRQWWLKFMDHNIPISVEPPSRVGRRRTRRECVQTNIQERQVPVDHDSTHRQQGGGRSHWFVPFLAHVFDHFNPAAANIRRQTHNPPRWNTAAARVRAAHEALNTFHVVRQHSGLPAYVDGATQELLLGDLQTYQLHRPTAERPPWEQEVFTQMQQMEQITTELLLAAGEFDAFISEII